MSTLTPAEQDDLRTLVLREFHIHMELQRRIRMSPPILGGWSPQRIIYHGALDDPDFLIPLTRALEFWLAQHRPGPEPMEPDTLFDRLARDAELLAKDPPHDP